MTKPNRTFPQTSLAIVFGVFWACGPVEDPELDVSDPLISLAALSSPWIARHDMSPATYQSEFNEHVADGYRLTWVSGYADGDSARYAALWEKSSGPAWVTRHGMTSAQYQQEFETRVAQGYRLSLVNGYAVGGTAYYVAIFEQKSGGAWVARHGMTSAQYQQEFETRVAQGYRLTHVSGYGVGGTAYYAAIFEQKSGGAWSARHGMTSSQYQQEFETRVAQGYRLTHVSGYGVGSTSYYAAIFEQKSGPGWTAKHGLSSANYQAAFDNQYYSGFRLKKVSGFTVGGNPRFAALWEGGGLSDANTQAIDDAVSAFMNNYSVPGLAIAIARDGRLVFAKGYGYADTDAGTRTSPLDRFRIASISKPVTSAGILTLLERGELQLGDRIFGRSGILGNNYGALPYGPGITSITVRQLLQHTAGGWSNSSNDPMFGHSSYDHDELISWVLNNRPLDDTPGTDYAYSNFGYCLLGRVIEAKTGVPYETWMQNEVLAPAGVTRMRIGGDTLAERKSREVVYYGQDGGNPYGMQVTRMDSHGGWIASPIDLVRFALAVDGFSTKPDILDAATIDTMSTGSAQNSGYGLGWSVNNSDNWWHSGSLPGTASELVRASNGFTWAIVLNTRSNESGFWGDLDGLGWDIQSNVSSWPSYDLF